MKFGLSDTVIDELCNVFRHHADIEKVLIFGSRSKGNYRAGSDIDLAIIGKNLDYDPIADHIDRVGQVFYEAA